MMAAVCNYSTHTHTLGVCAPQAFLVFSATNRKTTEEDLHRNYSQIESMQRMKRKIIFCRGIRCVGVNQE